MRQRKLIHPELMRALDNLTSQGVPLSAAMRKHKVEMSRPAVAKLLNYYQIKEDVVMASLFPAWLHHRIQEQPDTYEYVGYFPLGEWRCKL